MSARGWIAARWALVAAMAGSLAWAAPPVIRHSLGVVATPATDVTALIGQTGPAATTLDVTPILALAPFGRAETEVAAQENSTAADRPDLILNGILLARDAARSVALISLAGVQDQYRAGDPLDDTMRVASIAADHVVVQAGTREFQLRFDDLRETQATPEAVAQAPATLTDQLRALTVVAARSTRRKPPETTQEYIDHWRHRIRKNPQAVLDAIGLEPSDQGYRIAERHDRGVRLAGLRAGDLVRAVNGRPVGDPDEDRQYYDEIAASGQARIEIQRGDDVLTFSFPLQ